MILNQMDRGLTYLHSKTGYLKEETDYILTVVEIRELPRIKKLIYEIDPEAFVVISNVKEVKGHGFTSAKVYKKTRRIRFYD
ncbi:MAG: YitT family protein [Clostridium sp.]|nr:MAG: YitT family protein [Clostridium sp.]